MRDIQRLMKLHVRTVEEINETLVPFDEENAMDDINRQQQILETTNMQYGFMFPYHEQEDKGRLTWEGRYRIWKELWLLNYLGIALG